MEKRQKNKKRGPAVLSVLIATMLAVTLFAALPADGSGNSRESIHLGAGEHNGDATDGLLDVKAIATGEGHTLILKNDGTVWARGTNEMGQLGDGTDIDRNTPVQVVGENGEGYLTGVTAISAGTFHSFALKGDGTVWAWGWNSLGQLGDGTDVNSNTPVQVVGKDGEGYLKDVTAFAAGQGHSLALKGDGTVWAWGSNDIGQLGDGTDIDRNTPVQVVGKDGEDYLKDVTAISARNFHSFALKGDGTVWAWGANYDGRLGDGTDIDRNTPVQVVGENGEGYLTGVTVISTGGSHSLALKGDGTVWAWGLNNIGQLGDGTDEEIRNTPVQVVGKDGEGYLKDVTAFAAGQGHSFALKGDGTVWAWGSNDIGQLGDGTDIDRNTPVQVVGKDGEGYLTGVTAISAGTFHSFALKGDGTVWAWGVNWSGQLGDGTNTNRNTPVHIHIIESSLSHDRTGHWYQCPCGGIKTATEEHVFSSEHVYDENGHWYECGCGARAGVEEHIGTWIVDVAADHLTDGSKQMECIECDHIQTEIIYAEGHSFDDLKNNGLDHQYECECGDRIDAEEHVFNDIGNGIGECECGAVYDSNAGAGLGSDGSGDNTDEIGSGHEGGPSRNVVILVTAMIAGIGLSFMTVRRN